MADGEQMVSATAQVSLELAKMLAAALARVFDEIMLRTRVEYRLDKLKYKEALEQMNTSQERSDLGFYKDYQELIKNQDPNNPFVARGYRMTEEEAQSIMELARNTDIPYTMAASGQKNELGQDTYFVVTRQSDMEKIDNIFDLVQYDRRLSELSNVAQQVRTELESKKAELAQLDNISKNNSQMDSIELQNRITGLKNEIIEDTKFIEMIDAEYQLSQTARSYLVNKINLESTIEQLRQEYQDDVNLSQIDNHIGGLENEINELEGKNEELCNKIAEIQNIPEAQMSDDDKAELSTAKTKLSENSEKLEAMKSEVADYKKQKEDILAKQTHQNTASVRVDVNNTDYRLSLEPLTFSSAINIINDPMMANKENQQNYIILDRKDPSKYLEYEAVDSSKVIYSLKTNDNTYTFYNGRNGTDYTTMPAETKAEIQKTANFSDYLVVCKGQEDLERYQNAIINGEHDIKSNVEGFNRADYLSQDGYDSNGVDTRNYDARIAELEKELNDRGCVYKEQDSYNREVAVDIKTGEISADIESVLIANQIANYSELQQVNLEMANLTVTSYNADPTISNKAKEQLSYLQQKKAELCEIEQKISSDRVNLSTAKALLRENEETLVNAVEKYSKATSFELETAVSREKNFDLSQGITKSGSGNIVKRDVRTPQEISQAYKKMRQMESGNNALESNNKNMNIKNNSIKASNRNRSL